MNRRNGNIIKRKSESDRIENAYAYADDRSTAAPQSSTLGVRFGAFLPLGNTFISRFHSHATITASSLFVYQSLVVRSVKRTRGFEKTY